MPAGIAEKWLFRALVATVVAMGLRGAARANEPHAAPADLERRVRELEEIVRRLENERPSSPPSPLPNAADASAVPQIAALSQLPEREVVSPLEKPRSLSQAATTPGNDQGLTTGWNNGFFIRSADDLFSLRVTGQIQADAREFLREDDSSDIDNFFIRRARLGIEANMLKYYEFRLLPDFGQGNTRLQDAYMNVHYWDGLQLEVGKFKQPFSFEQLIQDRFVPVMERSLIDQLVPARDVGLMVHGQKLFDNHLDYAVSISDGEINGDTDTNDSKDVVGRIAWRPFAPADCWEYLGGLQLGVSASAGDQDESISPASLRTPAGVRWFSYNATVRGDGMRTRWSPEISYFLGGFGFAAQYLHEEQDMRPNTAGPGALVNVDVPMDGYYFLATYLLTGEERTSYSQPIDPITPFNPCCPLACPGAWELVFRLSDLRIDDGVFAPGATRLADPALFSNEAHELTLGLNWYLNKSVRAQFNWEHAWFEDPVRLASGSHGLLDKQDTLMARFQVIF